MTRWRRWIESSAAEAQARRSGKMSPRPWVQSYERRCIDTGRLDDRGDVCDGYSLAPVANEYDPAAEWELDAPAIAALHNDAPRPDPRPPRRPRGQPAAKETP